MSEDNYNKLQLAFSMLREELQFRRSREQHVFAWSSAILVAAIAATIWSDPGTGSLIKTCGGKVFAIVVVLAVVVGSIIWQANQRKLLKEVQRVFCRVETELGMFAIEASFDGDKVLPDRWRNWGRPPELSKDSRLMAFCQDLQSKAHLQNLPNKAYFTFGLGAVAVVGIICCGH